MDNEISITDIKLPVVGDNTHTSSFYDLSEIQNNQNDPIKYFYESPEDLFKINLAL